MNPARSSKADYLMASYLKIDEMDVNPVWRSRAQSLIDSLMHNFVLRENPEKPPILCFEKTPLPERLYNDIYIYIHININTRVQVLLCGPK